MSVREPWLDTGGAVRLLLLAIFSWSPHTLRIRDVPSTLSASEIASFQWAVARGAKAVDVAREHGFSPSNFSRWFRKYGRPCIPYEPTEADRTRARGWRKGRTLAEAWRLYRDFATTGPWASDAELPPFDCDDHSPDEFERLTLQTRPDARVLLVCEKLVVQNQLEEWAGQRSPSLAHTTQAALAWTAPLASRWVARTLAAHANSLRAPLAFFGDLDPQALHAFAALRAGGRNALLRGSGGGVPLIWLGLDSRWLDWVCRGLGVSDVPRSMRIRLGWLDQEYWQLVKRLVPDVRRLLGGRAYAMLEAGTKLEADALRGAPFVEELGRRLESLLRRRIG